MNLFKCLFALLLIASLTFPLHGAAQEQGPEEEGSVVPPEAHEKAIQALQTLGPDRGARKIDYRTATILGITKGIEAKSKEVQATLQDLSAKITETEIQIDLPGDILFDFDQWDIRPDAEETLEKIGKVIRVYESPQVVISGHTDSKGSEEYNQQLSEKRAESVKNWFVQHAGIEEDIMQTMGYGEGKPKVSNTNPDGSDNPEGRQQNRRVEILIKKG